MGQKSETTREVLLFSICQTNLVVILLLYNNLSEILIDRNVGIFYLLFGISPFVLMSIHSSHN